MINFPALQTSSRSREYDAYTPEQRAAVVRAYLFDSLSHRQIDKQVLKLDEVWSRGYQAMGVLHFLGLVRTHKGIFANLTVAEAVAFLEAEGKPEYAALLTHLKE